jgi:hypothetical protein
MSAVRSYSEHHRLGGSANIAAARYGFSRLCEAAGSPVDGVDNACRFAKPGLIRRLESKADCSPVDRSLGLFAVMVWLVVARTAWLTLLRRSG